MYTKSQFSHDQIVDNFNDVKERIKLAAESVGRSAADITLVVVKNFRYEGNSSNS